MVSPKISVIVPVYNAEKYLRRCLDCIISQDFQDFELLLVNDGSKDSSGLICNEYAQKDKRVHVINKKNGGASSARNVGLKASHGEYIAFSDADDWMEKKWLSFMMENIRDEDLLITGYVNHENNMIENKTLPLAIYYKDKIGDACLTLLDSFQMGYLWSMLFRSSIIKSNHILMDENMKIQEDLDFILRYIMCSHSFKTTNICQYHYYHINKASYCFTVYGVKKIMHSLKIILDEVGYNKWRKIYGDLVILIPLKDNTRNTIKEIRNYIAEYGTYHFSKTASVLLKVETLLPISLAIFFIRITKFILQKMHK